MRKNGNKLLKQAKKNKNDEFYTQYKDIENELKYYQNHFKQKTIYCNTDNPINSKFYEYFAKNFKKFGLKKLIASCYVDNELDLFNQFDNKSRAFYYEYTGDIDESIFPNLSEVTYFKGNGDFRSVESIELLKQADIVITNPPFSLFREYIAQIMEYKKKFLVIGNINAITYKEIFKLIKDNNAWMGINMGRGISGFIVPNHYELYGTETSIDVSGNRIISPNNCLWLTNLDHSHRHADIPLKALYKGNENKYPIYDNYDGINVNKTKDIPKDYKGAMGVPITFLHKFNPDQFEIIQFRKGTDNKDLSINGKNPYFRILIKNKRIN